MSKEKVTLTLDTEKIAELRTLVGAKSLSSTVESAITAELGRLRHLRAVDQWLLELDGKYGPPSPKAREWAVRVVDEWARPGTRRRRAG